MSVFICVISLLGMIACKGSNSIQQNPTDMIIEAVKNNKQETVRKLLTEGVDVESRDEQNRTLLMIATYQHNIAMAELLVMAKASVNAQDNIRNSPFLYAGAAGYLDLVKLYLNHGADFTVFNRYGGSALIPAAEKGHTEVVRLLATTPDFPVNHINNLGWTALMEAVVLGTGGKIHTEIVRILVDAGCDISIPDRDGITALEHARRRGFRDMAALLYNAK